MHVIYRLWLDLWFVICATKFECKVFSIFLSSFFLSSLLQAQLFNNASCFLFFCQVRGWACEVKGSLAAIIVLKAFSFKKLIFSYVLSLVVCNVDSSFSLAAFAILEAFSFTNPFIYNVLSFTILIIDPTFSLKALVVSKTFYFISSIVEPTFSFASPTFFQAFSVFSPIFCYTILKNSVAFCFNCSKIEPAP